MFAQQPAPFKEPDRDVQSLLNLGHVRAEIEFLADVILCKQKMGGERETENTKESWTNILVGWKFARTQSIPDATDNFSNANKLGQGAYGPVYKGKFVGDQEIAVKRLSRASRQGLQEFKNEVVLIAKLQHRNLVRLKGFCIEGEEKNLLYEYMPNQSLDFYIFDHTKSMVLNWEMRFNIILGIARGLLYHHQDSRLRIVHRDLKTSNILLDEEMNPKISDFGLARIVGGKETESNTNTVVGTYGYMSSEYALGGTFSIKSYVYSFGVILLEIISGTENTGFYQSQQTFSLISYAWKLWTENKALELMDKTLDDSCNKSQFIKCVNVGLLLLNNQPLSLGEATTPAELLLMSVTRPNVVIVKALSTI
ncbi:G-type lectin S-receptor-like serine/threonine-protein kinase At4g03230 [Prunus persica]|uniref:G-type lectin S-receptor-like serine/threonine-protein kinase At4g03230 n=1 Tax=Prunus persica TaxID=3760 RepID=UPI0009AB21BF|nr:G-type lectin S-receptor-like serine/threonine-protein kinase At4g03230 [Prunus persica]